MKEILEQILSQYYSELISEVEKAETLLRLKRIYDSGKVLELALKNLLLRLLPNYVGITRGIIFDSDVENISQEIDLILFDNRYFSGFLIDGVEEDRISLVPIDVVFGIISVKKTLNKESLKDCIQNINSVYNLKRKSFVNRFHYDMELGGAITYRNGIELNRIFSCIVSFKNEFMYKKSNGKSIGRTRDEIIEYLDKLGKQETFHNFRTDLIYSVDGVFMYPRFRSDDKSSLQRNAEINKLGEIKEISKFHLEGLVINPSNPDAMMLSYSIDMVNPKNALGQFLTYLQIYVSKLVKSTPDITKIFAAFFNLSEEGVEGAVQETRHIDDLLLKQYGIKLPPQ